jgi:hypothetical protein
MKIRLQRVHYMPKVLEKGVLYVSEEYSAAAHLCPCGCGSKVRTPLGPTDWTLEVTENGPTLYPSIGNWQLPCKSHYLITNGQIVWCSKWTTEQIASGRRAEVERARAYYNNLYRGRGNALRSLWNWLKNKLKSS